MRFTDSELAAVISGLRMLQHALISGTVPSAINEILRDSPSLGLSPEDIDDFCERLNCEETKQ